MVVFLRFTPVSTARTTGQHLSPYIDIASRPRYLVPMDLTVFLEPKVDLPRIRKILDELGHLGRLETIRGWNRASMRTLYDAAEGFRPVTLDDFVPPSVGDLVEVIHHGKNS